MQVNFSILKGRNTEDIEALISSANITNLINSQFHGVYFQRQHLNFRAITNIEVDQYDMDDFLREISNVTFWLIYTSKNVIKSEFKECPLKKSLFYA